VEDRLHYIVTKVVEIVGVNNCRSCPALFSHWREHGTGEYLYYRCLKTNYILKEEDLDEIDYDCPLNHYSEKEIEDMLDYN